jgi:Anti-sigma-K factor rskA, C-terminal
MMLSEQDIELAHPEAFDFVFGNLPQDRRSGFNGHLSGCRYCQSVVDEYADIGRIIKNLPPHAVPPADLEDRTVAAMVAALVEQRAGTDRRPDTDDQAVTLLYPRPERQPAPESKTRVDPVPQFQPPAQPETELRSSPAGQPPAKPESRSVVTRLPGWRRHRGRLAAVLTVAAAIIAAAIVIPLGLGGGRAAPVQATVVIPLYATTAAKVSGLAAATGRATARQDATGSWDITLTVQHLKNFGDAEWYQCWYVSGQHGLVTSAGTFVVPDSGSQTFSMTSAVDPHDFPIMEITIQTPNGTGSMAGIVVLIGHAL